MAYRYILVDKSEGVAKLTLNRPERLNAWMAQMRNEVGAALESFAADDTVRAVVITGAGRAFCAGHDRDTIVNDLKYASRREHDSYSYRRIIRGLTNLEKPVIAMVNGVATGGGLGLALWCDLIIASDAARFSQAFLRLGLSPPWGSAYLLPQLIGMARAKEIWFTGRMLDAAEAERIGLVNRVVPAAQLEAVTMKLATELAQGPTRAIGLTKRLLNKVRPVDLESFLLYETEITRQCAETEDLKEALAAFATKRTPQFKGR